MNLDNKSKKRLCPLFSSFFLFFHLFSNKAGKTHLIYLGKKRETLAKEYSANYKALLDMIEEMTILNMKLLKENACL